MITQPATEPTRCRRTCNATVYEKLKPKDRKTVPFTLGYRPSDDVVPDVPPSDSSTTPQTQRDSVTTLPTDITWQAYCIRALAQIFVSKDFLPCSWRSPSNWLGPHCYERQMAKSLPLNAFCSCVYALWYTPTRLNWNSPRIRSWRIARDEVHRLMHRWDIPSPKESRPLAFETCGDHYDVDRKIYIYTPNLIR